MPGDYGNVNFYMWVPIVGPLIGGVLGAYVYDFAVRNVLIARGAEPDPEIEEAAETAIDEPGGAASMSKYVGAIDQGTTSSRFILFDKDGNIVHIDQREHEQITPKAGWVEHDATEIWQNTRRVIGGAMADSDVEAGDVAAIGITNQRETTVVWDRETGEPVYNAIVWQDTRTGGLVRELAGDEGVDRLRDVTGLPLSHLLLRPEDHVAPRQRRRRPQAGRERRAAVRHDGHAGCCGTSPAARTAASTSPTSPTPAARC